MSQVFLYAHGGSGNHGCEAIVRSTIKILDNRNITLISSRPDDDVEYGLGNICRIIKDRSSALNKADRDFWKAYFALKIKKDYIPMDKLWYKEAFQNIKKNDIAISIGGDNYCYEDVDKYVMLHNMIKERGAKTILWGCSVEPSVARNPKISEDLKKYNLITARETITYEVLRQINKNTMLVSDPAFALDSMKTDIPEMLIEGNTVGINISPMIIENEKTSNIIWSNYIELIDYILSATDMNIALIPHVVWKNGDDRIPLTTLYDKYKDTNRICMVRDQNCEKLKYIISKCRFFVGARTHSTIAAYSSGIPTLVMGYSVKSRGIARDIFGSENGYVLAVQDLNSPKELCDYFKNIYNNERTIRKHLEDTMPEYISKSGVDIESLLL